MEPTVLVTGSEGQIGSELTPLLREKYGADRIIAGTFSGEAPARKGPARTERLDVTKKEGLLKVMGEHSVDIVYHLAAVLSAAGENDPQLAWSVNISGLKNVLDVSRDLGVSKVFWPSSIAVFGPDAPKEMAPQDSPLDPTTMYGVSKVAGELLCNYYHLKYGLDVRCLRYPGLISSATKPGGGTTDYAVEMFYAALENRVYESFVREDTVLPMMYMPDALRAAFELMDADEEFVKRHTGYNLAAMSFSVGELAAAIRKHVPGFSCEYLPDSRQAVADAWPRSVDDREARKDWGWIPRYDMGAMTEDMFLKLSRKPIGAAPKG